MSVPTLLGLDELEITYEDEYPDGVVWLNDNLSCEHGLLARKGGGKATIAPPFHEPAMPLPVAFLAGR